VAAKRDPKALSGHARLVPRRDRPAVRSGPVADPRVASAPARRDPALVRAGKRAALAVAVVGVLWIAATAAGQTYGWSVRTRAFFDLFALAGFAWALYLTWQVRRLARTHKG
jgi:hypothetical protein